MRALIDRHVEPWLTELLEHFPAVEVEGAHQVGKSTLAAAIANRANATVSWFTFDDPSTLRAARSDPEQFLALNRNGLVVIDEFQRAPELILPLKAEIDAHRTSGRFLLTGSSRITLSDRSADSLVGRIVDCRVRGFSQGEINRTHDDFVTAVAGGINPIHVTSGLDRSGYVDLLARGSMPEMQALSTRLRNTWFASYLDRISTKDVQEVSKVSDSGRLASLLRAIASLQGFEFVLGRVANDLSIPASTASNYLKLLEGLFLVDLLRPWTPNLLKREVGRPKVMIHDSGFALWLSRTSPETLKDFMRGQALGGLLEAFVVEELLKQQAWSDTQWQLSHYRSADGREIDAVIELDDQRVIGVEVKAAVSVRPDDFKHLEWLRDKLGDRFVCGVVLTTGPKGQFLGDRLMALPVSALWDA